MTQKGISKNHKQKSAHFSWAQSPQKGAKHTIQSNNLCHPKPTTFQQNWNFLYVLPPKAMSLQLVICHSVQLFHGQMLTDLQTGNTYFYDFSIYYNHSKVYWSIFRSQMGLLPKFSWVAILEIAGRSQQNLYPNIAMIYVFIWYGYLRYLPAISKMSL